MKMKKIMFLAACMIAAVLGAAETVFDGNSPAVWTSKRITSGNDGILSGTCGFAVVKSKEFIPVEKGKTYVISGEFRLVEPPAKATIYFGFIPYTETGREIPYYAVTTVSKSVASLAKDVNAGDNSIVLKDAEKWKINTLGRIVFNAKEDLSDLPNFDFSPALESKQVKVNTDGTIEIPVKKPFAKAYPAGTVVRQHIVGNAYIYAGAGRKANEWMTFSKRYTTFYPGTAKIKLAFNMNVAKCQIEMRNIKVTVE